MLPTQADRNSKLDWHGNTDTQPYGVMKMKNEAKVRICHAILNGSKLNDIAEVQQVSISQVKQAWESIAGSFNNPPCDHRNLRECMFFRGDWRRLISTMG